RPPSFGLRRSWKTIILLLSKSEFLKGNWRIRFVVISRIRRSRLITSAHSERWLLVGQMILSGWSWKSRGASSLTFNRRRASAEYWESELNSKSFHCRLFAYFWERNSTRCFVGSTKRGFGLTSRL